MKLKVSLFSVCVSLFWLVLAMGVQAADAAKPSDRVAEALKLLETKVTALGAASVAEGVLSFGKTKMNDDVAVVDAVKAEKGCAATVFVKKGDDFVRISTNVMKEDKRAVGTPLDAKGAAFKALSAGESFFGTIEVVGTQMEVGYQPIKVDNKVVGALFVGFPVK